MTDYAARIAALPPDKRELLLQRLGEKQPAATRLSDDLPQIAPNPEERHLPFPLMDIQRTYWIGQSGLFDLSTCANVYLEDEITYRIPQQKLTWNWQSLLGWLLRTFGRKYLENRIATFFVERFNVALRRLIERHDMLRAVILPDGQQQVLPQVPAYQVNVIDLRKRPLHHVEAELAKIRERLRYAKTSMDQWPLFEFIVCLLDERRIRLLVRVDPLIIDGESRLNLIVELNQLLINPQAFLPPLECTYRDYAMTWAAFQKSDLFQRSRDYWLAQVPTLPPAPDLPTTRHIGPETRPRFEFLSLDLLAPEDWQRLKAHAARVDLSPSGIVLAAFVEVLAAWSLEPRFTLGLIGTYHPPMHPQIEDVFGNFNNLAVLGVENWPGTFAERAIRLWEQLVADLEHRYFSGHQVLQELNRRAGGTPKAIVPIYFNSVVEHRQPNQPARRQQAEQEVETDETSLYDMASIEIGAYFPQILLTSILQERGDGTLFCRWQIVEDVFPPGMIKEMMDAYRRLLQRLADDEQSWHGATHCLVPAEQLAQRTATNSSAAQPPQEMLHALFAAQVSRQPSQVAVIAKDQSLTYEALYQRANQVARRLRELGSHPNTLIAVVMEPGWEQVVAVLGVLASGAAYVPIAPHLSQDRLAHLLEHSEAKWVLTQSWLDEDLEWPDRVQRLCVDIDEEWMDVDDHPLDPIQTFGDLACVIYSSVSSGPPRGTMIDHQSAVNTILDVNRKCSVGPQDRVLALSPLGSALSVYDIFGVLAAGGTVVVPPVSAVQDPAMWSEMVHRHRITVWNSSPALLDMLLAAVAEHSDITLRSLRLVLLSQGRISVTLPGRLKALVEDAQVLGLWGAPGVAVWSGLCVINDTVSQGNLCGRPLTNQRLYVLDPWLEPRPVWVPGRLYVGGTGLAQGHWKDDDETQARFVQLARTGERLYRTDEFGRFLPDGTIEFLGQRGEFRAMAYGYQVEPRQIEAALEQHSAVRECIVVAQKGTHHHNRLIAYVVPHSGSDPSVEVLREFIEKLPGYMMPATFVLLPSMPLTFTGQVDRDALPVPVNDVASPQAGKIVPRNTRERRLVQIWEALLDVEQIGVTDNFFDLGGNSFLAARLINQVRDEFGAEQALYAFLYEPTIEHLSNMIETKL